MTKPRKIPEAAVKRITLEVAEIAGWLAARSTRIAKANDFADDGRKGVDYAAVRRGGQELTSPEAFADAALSGRGDGVAAQAAEFMDTLHRWQQDARRLKYLGVNLGVEWTEDAKSAASFVAKRENGEGDCVNCGRYVPGTRNDRLRHDRCEACARYWSRSERTKERPRHLFGSDSVDDTCQTMHTSRGVDTKCGLEHGHAGDCAFAAQQAVG